METQRIALIKEHDSNTKTMANITTQIEQIQNKLNTFVHEPENFWVYTMNSILIALGCLICIGLNLLKNSIMNFFLRHQIKHARILGIQEKSLLTPPGQDER